MTEYIIEAKGLTKRFGKKLALNNFDLQIPFGGIHALIGANGAGKSTLFRILLGFESPTVGNTFVLGMDSQELTPEMFTSASGKELQELLTGLADDWKRWRKTNDTEKAELVERIDSVEAILDWPGPIETSRSWILSRPRPWITT